MTLSFASDITTDSGDFDVIDNDRTESNDEMIDWKQSAEKQRRSMRLNMDSINEADFDDEPEHTGH